MPLRNMNYYDPGTFQYFNDKKWDPATSWGEILLHNIGNTIHEIVTMNDIQDHIMDNYLAKLKKLANVGGIRRQ